MEKMQFNQKGVVIYESKYGATHQYAQWLGEALKLPVVRPDELSTSQLESFDFLLIGTPVYMGKFRIKEWIKKNVKHIIHKKLFLFVVNATAPDEQVKREQFVLKNVPAEIRNASAIYFLPGRLIHSKLSFFDKLMVKMGERIEKNPAKKIAMRSDMDAVKKENLLPLIKAVDDYFLVNERYHQPV